MRSVDPVLCVSVWQRHIQIAWNTQHPRSFVLWVNADQYHGVGTGLIWVFTRTLIDAHYQNIYAVYVLKCIGLLTWIGQYNIDPVPTGCIKYPG